MSTLVWAATHGYRNGPVAWSGLAASLILVAVAVLLSVRQQLGLTRDLVVATVRAAAQLLVVGFALDLILRPRVSLWWAWGWVVLMVVVAAVTVAHRASEVPGALSLALLAIGASVATGLAVIFGFGIFPLEGRSIVPVSGMLVGNAMTATIVASRRIIGELSDKRPEVEARLALGLPWQDASRPYVRAALRLGVVSQVEATKAVGLVALPGAMTGLILAGVRPLDAVRVQAAVMYLILGAVATSVSIVGLGLTRRLFTSDHRLVRLTRR